MLPRRYRIRRWYDAVGIRYAECGSSHRFWLTAQYVRWISWALDDTGAHYFVERTR